MKSFIASCLAARYLGHMTAGAMSRHRLVLPGSNRYLKTTSRCIGNLHLQSAAAGPQGSSMHMRRIARQPWVATGSGVSVPTPLTLQGAAISSQARPALGAATYTTHQLRRSHLSSLLSLSPLQLSRRGVASSLAPAAAAAGTATSAGAITLAPGLLDSILGLQSHDAMWTELQAAIISLQGNPGSVSTSIGSEGKALAAAVASLAVARAEGLTGPQLCNLYWALACLGHADAATATLITESLYSRLGELSCQDLAALIWAQAITGHYNHEVFASLTEFVWERCLTATPKQLAVLAASYASYGHFDDDHDFFDALAASFYRKLGSSQISDTALMLKSLAVLQLDAATTATFPGDVQPEGSAGGAPSTAAPAAAAAKTPGERFFSAASKRLVAQLQDNSVAARPGDLADIVWAYASVGHHDPPLMSLIGDRLVAVMKKPSVGQPAPPTAGVHWAQAQARKKQDEAAAGAGVGAGSTEGQPHAGGPQGTAGGRGADVGQAKLFRGCVLAGGLLTHKAQHNPCLTASASSGQDPNTYADGMQSPETLTKLLWSYAVLRQWHSRLIQGLWQQLARLSAEQLTPAQAARIGAAHTIMVEMVPGIRPVPTPYAQNEMVWRYVCNNWPAALRTPDPLLPRALVEFHAQELYEDDLTHYQSWKYRPTKDLSRLSLRESVLATLKALGREPYTASTFDGTLTPHLGLVGESADASDGSNGADGAGKSTTVKKGSLQIAIELLDPSSCMRTEPHPATGPVLSRHRSLRFRGWKVLTVPFHEWLSMAGDQAARETYLSERIKALQTSSK